MLNTSALHANLVHLLRKRGDAISFREFTFLEFLHDLVTKRLLQVAAPLFVVLLIVEVLALALFHPAVMVSTVTLTATMMTSAHHVHGRRGRHQNMERCGGHEDQSKDSDAAAALFKLVLPLAQGLASLVKLYLKEVLLFFLASGTALWRRDALHEFCFSIGTEGIIVDNRFVDLAVLRVVTLSIEMIFS